jgi:hypothetical protein
MRPRNVLLAMIIAVAVTPTAAMGDSEAIRDPNDARGLLDIATASHGHDGRSLVHEVTMHEKWRSRTLGRNTDWITIFVDIRRAEDRYFGFERTIAFRYRAGKLKAFLYKHGADELVARLRVRRPDPRTVRVWVRPDQLSRRPMDRYWWYAETTYRDCCSDLAPSGDVEHRL